MASTDRRTLLKLVMGGGAAALGTAVVAPAVAFVLPARGGDAGHRWVRTVPLDALSDGVPFRVKIISDQRDAWKLEKDAELGSVWLVRDGEKVRALSVVCPHLGCAIVASGEGFACPCHDSSFDGDGERRSGPSPRDMDPLETRIVTGSVEVDFRRYRQGTPERIEIG